MKNILFPVDFSVRANSAAPYVAEMARACDASVTLLHAVNRADYVIGAGELGVYGMEDVYRDAVQGVRQQLDTYLTSEFDGIAVNRVVVEGEASAKILEFEREQSPWLIMMPTHGLGVFRRFILGSVTAKVLHDAHCPVWTSAHIEDAPGDAKHSVHRVLCAIDLGEYSEAALRWAAAVAEVPSGSLTVCHAVPSPEARPDRYLDQEFANVLSTEAREDVGKILARTGIKASICIQAGDPATAIRSAAEGHRADLIVIARGSTGEGHGRLRTHGYSIIREAPVPVISV